MDIKQILLPVDDSVHSEHAAETAISIAARHGARVTLVTCYDKIPIVDEVPTRHLDEYKKQIATQAGKVLTSYREKLEASGIEFRERLKEGAAGEVISEMAATGKYDVVIMGSGGHSSLAGLFVGSVTHKVISTMHCPVLIVP